MSYQPKTGERCTCGPGIERDNCPQCEGTGERIDFKAIRERKLTTTETKHTPGIERAAEEINSHLALVNCAMAKTRLCEIIARNTAAPELLEACKTLLQLVRLKFGNLYEDTNAIQAVAIAAIQKAEGVQ